MAAPNIVDVTSIYGKTTGVALADTSITQLLANAGGSDKVLKVNLVRATNVDGTNDAEVTLYVYLDTASPPTSIRAASTITVPADAAIDLINKNSSVYLEEGQSLHAQASAGDDLELLVSYEEMDDA